jgi:hypothetical protein
VTEKALILLQENSGRVPLPDNVPRGCSERLRRQRSLLDADLPANAGCSLQDCRVRVPLRRGRVSAARQDVSWHAAGARRR